MKKESNPPPPKGIVKPPAPPAPPKIKRICRACVCSALGIEVSTPEQTRRFVAEHIIPLFKKKKEPKKDNKS